MSSKAKDQHSLIKLIDHVIVDDFRASAVQLHNLLDVRIVGIDRSELHAAASEQNQKVLAIVIVDFLWESERERENRITFIVMWTSQIAFFCKSNANLENLLLGRHIHGTA